MLFKLFVNQSKFQISCSVRQITDCSRPIGKSMNYHCDSLLNVFCFKNVDNVVSMLNHNDYMTVIDIKAAYRAVPILAEHRTFQGFIWKFNGESRWFVDNRLCFGLRLGPMYFNYISNFIYDILSSRGLNIVNYLDDFIAVPHDLESSLAAQDEIVKCLRYLGFHVAFDKLIFPSRCVTYLGIEIDSVRMELRLPEGKVQKLKVLLKSILSRKRISKHELESIGGLLSHCSHVIKGGKIFCKRVYTLYKELIQRNARFINVSDLVKLDLNWWLSLCDYFNGSNKIVKSDFELPMV